jgi:phosphate-selective porin
MAGSQAFEWLCEAIETGTSLERLEARGTVRIALKEAGLEARTATPAELAVVVAKVLPRELRQRGVADEAALCGRLAAGLRNLDVGAQPVPDTPDAIFRRLGGGL